LTLKSTTPIFRAKFSSSLFLIREQLPSSGCSHDDSEPEHTHGPGLQCNLCETHGDVLNSGLTGEEYIGCMDVSED